MPELRLMEWSRGYIYLLNQSEAYPAICDVIGPTPHRDRAIAAAAKAIRARKKRRETKKTKKMNKKDIHAYYRWSRRLCAAREPPPPPSLPHHRLPTRLALPFYNRRRASSPSPQV